MDSLNRFSKFCFLIDLLKKYQSISDGAVRDRLLWSGDARAPPPPPLPPLLPPSLPALRLFPLYTLAPLLWLHLFLYDHFTTTTNCLLSYFSSSLLLLLLLLLLTALSKLLLLLFVTAIDPLQPLPTAPPGGSS